MRRASGQVFSALLASMAPKGNEHLQRIYKQAARSADAVLQKRPALPAAELPELAALWLAAREVARAKSKPGAFSLSYRGGRFRAICFSHGGLEVRTWGGLPLTLGLDTMGLEERAP